MVAICAGRGNSRMIGLDVRVHGIVLGDGR